MNRTIAFSTLLLAFASGLAAQDETEEKFNDKQADRLHAFAKDAFKRGFPRQARLIWLQAIKLYSPDHAEAHKALGNVRLGKAWNPDPAFKFPLDDTGTGADGKALYAKFEALKKALASAHRQQAEQWEKAGRRDRSLHHFKMVLRWVKDDQKAQQALQHKAVGGVTGTDLEQVLYENSKKIEKAVVEQTKINYPVEELTDNKNPLLDRANVTYMTFKSEHFIIRGDHEAALLKEALVWGERALRVMQVAFPKDGEFSHDVAKWPCRDFAHFIDKNTYKQVLKANAQLVSDLEWRLEHSSTCRLGTEKGVCMIGATGNRQTMFDSMVRDVARNYSGFNSDGLSEGVGHTFVGMIFNNNRLFSVDLKKQQGTRASEEDREYVSPNFDVWKDLALEQAWKISGGVSAAQLPMVKAHSFTNQERIKAWSFCDYVMRRDPKLLLSMDRKSQFKNIQDIQDAFQKENDVTIAQLDKEWEDFWTGASPVLQAIKSSTPPLAAISADVSKWLAAFNAARKENNCSPATYSANYSSRCHDHAKYLLANKSERGPDKVQSQDPQLEGGSHLGNMFAQMALIETKASVGQAKKMFKRWLSIPGYRDALVNTSVLSIGLYSEGGILVMNATSGLGVAADERKRGYSSYPGRKDVVDTEVAVDLLGSQVRKLLDDKGKAKAKVVGFPLTLHFGAGIPGTRSSYQCIVKPARGQKVEGVILMDDGENRHTSAPGMVTFIPLEPLPKGPIQMTWTWESDGTGRSLDVQFTAQ